MNSATSVATKTLNLSAMYPFLGQELATLVGREPKFPRKRAFTGEEESKEAPPAAR